VQVFLPDLAVLVPDLVAPVPGLVRVYLASSPPKWSMMVLGCDWFQISPVDIIKKIGPVRQIVLARLSAAGK